ncbi:MAG: hypothetical protein PHQ75_12710, partial [Thermoguttaceae bacterium]|nr:hypothetical protein [Thermoguttaceae bacterium]
MKKNLLSLLFFCSVLMNQAFSNPPPEGVIQIQNLSPNASVFIDEYQETATDFQILIDTASPISGMTITPKVFPIKNGNWYLVNSNRFYPYPIQATRDGSLQITCTSAINLTVTLKAYPGNDPGRYHWPNESFEEVGTKKIPRDFKAFQTTSDSILEVTEETARTGKRSLKIRADHTGHGRSAVLSTKPIAVVPGEEYLAQGWYKTEGAPLCAKIFFRTFLASDNKDELRFVESGSQGAPIRDRGGQWQRIFLTFKVPEDLTSPRVTISFGQENYPVTVFWDDLGIMPLPKKAPQFSRRLTQEQKTPVHSADEVLKYWSNRDPWQVSLPLSDKDSKSNIIKVDGKPLTPYGFVQNYGDMYWPSWAAHKDFFEAGFDLQWLVYDPNQVTKRFGGPLWKKDGDYDFDYLEKKLLELLRFQPKAKVALYVSLWVYPEFADRHPEAAWINAKGEKTVGEKYEWQPESERKPGQRLNHSIAARAFAESAGDYLFAMGQFLSKSVVGKAVVGVHLVGGADGQWFVPGWGRDFGQYDYSEGARVAFGNWLRKQYKNDLTAFRKAWGNDKLLFETAVMPPEKERATKNFFLMPDRPSDRRVIDANHFMYAGNCETVFHLAKSFKSGIGRPVFVTTYYPYNQLGLGEILQQNWLDGTVSVPNYGGCREAGNFGDVATVPDSLRLHHRFFLGELDYRTELSVGSGDHHEYAESVGAANNVDEARSAIWRELGGELSHGGGAWHYALMGNAWNDPTHMNYMKIGHRIAKESVESADPKQRGQIAVFSDHKAIN